MADAADAHRFEVRGDSWLVRYIDTGRELAAGEEPRLGGKVIELTDDELASYQRNMTEFNAWRERLHDYW
jgi:hypothetical protein